LNLHAVASASPSSWCVCQFHHEPGNSCAESQYSDPGNTCNQPDFSIATTIPAAIDQEVAAGDRRKQPVLTRTVQVTRVNEVDYR
jgi:hypothetical protein